MSAPLPSGDLDHILAHTQGLWEPLRGQRIFITGGTGFFGIWVLESFLGANEAFNLGATALILSRNPQAFRTQHPHLATHPALAFHEGDIRGFEFPEGRFSHVLHMATTSALETFQGEDPLAKFDTVAAGTRHALDFAVRCGAERFLLTSSGAVYGPQPPSVRHIPEDHPGAPDPTKPGSALGLGKRVAEFLCEEYSRQHDLETVIARCFAFVGPHLPLDIHYAIGNFLRDAIKGGPIHVQGDGTPVRSYLYIADLMVWLWTLLLKEESRGIYNVGSSQEISISELAHLVSDCTPGHPEVLLAQAPTPAREADWYVPSVRRAQEQLGLREWISLPEAIRRTRTYLESNEPA